MTRGLRFGLAHGKGVEIWPHTCQGGQDLAIHMSRGVASNLSRGVNIWPCSCQRCQNLASDMSRGSRCGLAHVEGVEQIIITQANVMNELCGRSGGWGAACCSESC